MNSISAFIMGEVCRAKLSGRVNAIEQDLRRLRIQIFEPMIDWAAMAGK